MLAFQCSAKRASDRWCEFVAPERGRGTKTLHWTRVEFMRVVGHIESETGPGLDRVLG